MYKVHEQFATELQVNFKHLLSKLESRLHLVESDLYNSESRDDRLTRIDLRILNEETERKLEDKL